MKKILFIFLFIFININVYSQWYLMNNLPIPFDSTLSDVYFVNSNTGWIVGDNGRIFMTVNGGTNWILKGSGTINSLYSIYFTNSQIGWIAGAGGTIVKTINGGTSWVSQSSGTTNSLYSICFINSLTGWIAAGKSIIKTSNAGTNWIMFYVGYTFNSIYFTDSQTGWGVGSEGTKYKTTDGGTDWMYQNESQMYNLSCVYFIDSQTGWIVGGDFGNHTGLIFKTVDGGTSWFNQTIASPLIDRLGAIRFKNSQTGWIIGDFGGYSGHIFKTVNGGNNWALQTSATFPAPCSIFMIDLQTGWAVGGSPIVVGGGTILKTTNGGGVFISKISSNIPNKYNLSQNFPNPFNPVTNINFDIPKNTYVKVKIFDILGKEIETLVNEKLNPGTYEVTFNASQYPSGVYFYRLQAGDYNECKKMILIK